MQVLRKPLGLEFDAADLEKEKDAMLLGAYDGDKLVACCTLTKLDPQTCKLSQMAVHQRMQRHGMGAAIMVFAENMAKDAGFKKMVMHARETATGFYQKLGYQEEGETFSEVGLPHIKMHKTI